MLSKINQHFFPDKDRVLQSFIYLRGEITIESCANVIESIIESNVPTFELDDEEEQLIESPTEDVINLLITSPGGDMAAAFALINVMRGSKIPIRTIAIGEASSAALCILMSGSQRVATPYASLMSHQFNSGTEGSYSQLKNVMNEFDVYHEKMIKLYAENTGLPIKTIKKYLLADKDNWLDPEKALSHNIVDFVSDLA